MSIVMIAAVYGTLVGGNMVEAPKVVDDGEAWRATASLSEAKANALGYFAVVDVAPECAENEYAVPSGWAMDGNRIVRQYAKQIRPVAIPRYSVADLIFWAALNGKIDTLVAWLKSAGYYEVVLTTREFAADNEVFGVIKAAVVSAGIVTDVELSAALEYALIGGAE